MPALLLCKSFVISRIHQPCSHYLQSLSVWLTSRASINLSLWYRSKKVMRSSRRCNVAALLGRVLWPWVLKRKATAVASSTIRPRWLPLPPSVWGTTWLSNWFNNDTTLSWFCGLKNKQVINKYIFIYFLSTYVHKVNLPLFSEVTHAGFPSCISCTHSSLPAGIFFTNIITMLPIYSWSLTAFYSLTSFMNILEAILPVLIHPSQTSDLTLSATLSFIINLPLISSYFALPTVLIPQKKIFKNPYPLPETHLVTVKIPLLHSTHQSWLIYTF